MPVAAFRNGDDNSEISAGTGFGAFRYQDPVITNVHELVRFKIMAVDLHLCPRWSRLGGEFDVVGYTLGSYGHSRQGKGDKREDEDEKHSR